MSRARDLADLAGSADAGGLTGKNMVVNGAMTISQRGTDFNDVANGTYTIDRFKLGKINTDNAVINIDQVTTSPDGFSNSLKISVGTAESALAADEGLLLQHLIEAQNLQHLQNGSSGAQSVTLSFWVRSDKTGTYTVAIRKPDNTDRNQSKEYTISAADTWEHKSLTFSGDTSGGGIANDNGAGFFCDWWLAGGSNFTGGTMDTWANTATQRLSTNQVNLMDGTNEWYITGVQLEVGEQATPFDHSESYGDTLRRCQRYFEKSFAQGTNPGTSTTTNLIGGAGAQGNTTTGELAGGKVRYMATKRATPTIVVYDDVGNSGKCKRINYGVTATANEAVVALNIGDTSFDPVSYSGSAASGLLLHFTADAEL